MDQMGGIDLGFYGGRFTWDKKQGVVVARGQLDKSIANRDSIDKFPTTLVCHLNTEESDHALFS